ncbi:MAG: type II toxin-antitoxin system HicB family antitoxin [Methylobacter sp.]|jgi:predicted HicB family RNase H-like nuclease
MAANNKTLQYKGFLGSIEMDLDEFFMFGELLFINDLVTYEAKSLEELQREFEISVDDYLETCKELKREPQKPYSGTFNVRIGGELHRQVAIHSLLSGASINDFVKTAVQEKIEDKKHIHNHIHYHASEVVENVTFGKKEEEQWTVN